MAAMKRNENESFSEYRIKLREMSQEEKVRAKGILVWDSKKKGTYIKKSHGEI